MFPLSFLFPDCVDLYLRDPDTYFIIIEAIAPQVNQRIDLFHFLTPNTKLRVQYLFELVHDFFVVSSKKFSALVPKIFLVYNRVLAQANMLEINVSQMLKGGIGTEKIVPVSGDVCITGYGVRTVNGTARLTRTNRSILVHGKLHTSVMADCARCLSVFECPLDMIIEEEYFPMADVSSGIPLPEPDESGAFIVDEHMVLDLAEAVRQYALITMPMKPLCRPNCPGIIIES